MSRPKPNKYGSYNFRGIKKVCMVTVLEGDGTNERPYQQVNYIYDDKNDQYIGHVSYD